MPRGTLTLSECALAVLALIIICGLGYSASSLGMNHTSLIYISEDELAEMELFARLLHPLTFASSFVSLLFRLSLSGWIRFEKDQDCYHGSPSCAHLQTVLSS